MNLPDKSGVRPLLLACHTGDIKIVEFMYKNGADSLLAFTKECSVLHICAERDFHEISKFLAENSAIELL